jgi:hypothetical protein
LNWRTPIFKCAPFWRNSFSSSFLVSASVPDYMFAVNKLLERRRLRCRESIALISHRQEMAGMRQQCRCCGHVVAFD